MSDLPDIRVRNIALLQDPGRAEVTFLVHLENANPANITVTIEREHPETHIVNVIQRAYEQLVGQTHELSERIRLVLNRQISR